MKPNLNPKNLAGALFKISADNNVLDDVKNSLMLLNDIVAGDSQFRVFIQSKKVEVEKKSEILNAVLGKTGHPLVNEMVSYLNGSKAPTVLRSISNIFDSMYQKKRNIIDVKGVVAYDISDSTLQTLKESLDSILGKDTKLSIKVDPVLIGGIKLRIGNTFLDASIQNQLQTLRTELLQI
mgnify:CR=1 FL=1